MYRISAVLLFIIFSQVTKAQGKDSLVKKTDLRFKNDVEKLAFQKTDLANPDHVVGLLLSSYEPSNLYSDSKAIQQIDQCVKTLHEETAGKTDAKKVKYIYDYVHKQFLKVYKLQNSFADIFSKGEYNCVSASALYSIIFTKLGIPHNVIEAPQHVYLVAYPQTLKILIETTSPEKGYYQFNDNFVHQYVKVLYNSKLISKEEYDGNSASTLFDKYYFTSKGLSLSEVASLQFSNYCIYHLEEKKYNEAIEEIKKAYYLNASDRNKYILKSTLIYHIQNNKYEKKELVEELGLLCRLNDQKDEELSSEQLKNEFLRLTEGQLINHSDYEMYDSSYNTIIKEISDTNLRKEVSFVYHFELSRLGYLNNKDTAYELSHLRAAYRVNPKNANLQSIILSYLERQIKLTDDPKIILKEVNQYSHEFDFTNNNNAFNNVRANCILELAYQYFTINDPGKGEAHLKEFENLVSEKKDTRANDNFIERAYASAAAMYYKKGNVARSKQFLKTGLLYSPDNFGLKTRLNQL